VRGYDIGGVPGQAPGRACPGFCQAITSHQPASGDQSTTAGVMRDGLWASRQKVENWKMVVVLNCWPGLSTVDGKFGWFGEFGKCCVSNV
jgi:hypothetical protein